jgi:hypothetical protein
LASDMQTLGKLLGKSEKNVTIITLHQWKTYGSTSNLMYNNILMSDHRNPTWPNRAPAKKHGKQWKINEIFGSSLFLKLDKCKHIIWK